MTNVFMFSGQGAQYFQMGRVLFEKNHVFRDSMLDLDGVARRLLGESIVGALYETSKGISEIFDQIRLTHPAIFMVEYAMARALISAGVMPGCLLGVSLGTFAASVVAGCLEPESALEMVIEHASAIEAECPRGIMIAVLAPLSLAQENFLKDRCEVAAVNSDGHFVISAPQAHCQQIERDLLERRVTFVRLPVHYAFHSRWIEPAKARLEASSLHLSCKPVSLPIVCCQRAALLPEVSSAHLWAVTREPIRFRESVAILAVGSANRYIDVGPSGSLAVLLKHSLTTLARSSIYSVMTPYGRDMENFALVTAREQERYHETEIWPSCHREQGAKA